MKKEDAILRIEHVLEDENRLKRYEDISEIQMLIQELNTYHTELEFQNEELKRTEVQLRESMRFYHDLFEQSPYGYIVYRPNGEITEINKRMRDWLNWEEQLNKEQTVFALIAKESQDAFYFHQKEILQNDEVRVAEIVMRAGDSPLYVHMFSEREVLPDGVYIKTACMNITSRIKQSERLLYLSYHDQLTGLYNRHYFEEKLLKGMKHSSTTGVVYIDINDLKMVNDVFSHEKGDWMLGEVAAILDTLVGTKGYAVRWGGDEFILVILDTDREGIKKIKESIILGVKGIEGLPFEITVSVGYSMVEQCSGDLMAAIAKAETVMYYAKYSYHASSKKDIVRNMMENLQRSIFFERDHCHKLQSLCRRLGQALSLDHYSMKQLKQTCFFINIGNLVVENKLLTKDSSLEKEERYEMESHTEAGYKLLKGIPEYADIADLVLYHHEHYDGTGYPRGLQGDEIPYVDRIIRVIDAYVAMISERPYRHALTEEAAVAELIKGKGKVYDPYIVDVFVDKVLQKRPNEVTDER